MFGISITNFFYINLEDREIVNLLFPNLITQSKNEIKRKHYLYKKEKYLNFFKSFNYKFVSVLMYSTK